mgnify:CR=1 FL=1|tara:strand:+ start:1747 stop:2010 length:264 start_codon:yes stop_codon:yes gene_type:complete
MNFLIVTRKLLIVFVLVFSIISIHAQEHHGPYKIHKIIDGDTFWVKIEGGKTENIVSTSPSTYFINPIDRIGLHQKQIYEKSKPTRN